MGTSPVFIKQLLAAVVLTAAGALVLGHLARPVSAPSAAVPGETAVNAEAIFTSTPRQQPVEEPKPATAARTVSKPKTVAAAPTRQPDTPPVYQAPIGAPLSIAPSAEQVQAATQAAAAEANDTSIMGRVRSVGASVQQLPQRTYSTVTGWFSSPGTPSAPDGPPRPPADVPQKLKAEMYRIKKKLKDEDQFADNLPKDDVDSQDPPAGRAR